MLSPVVCIQSRWALSYYDRLWRVVGDRHCIAEEFPRCFDDAHPLHAHGIIMKQYCDCTSNLTHNIEPTIEYFHWYRSFDWNQHPYSDSFPICRHIILEQKEVGMKNNQCSICLLVFLHHPPYSYMHDWSIWKSSDNHTVAWDYLIDGNLMRNDSKSTSSSIVRDEC